MRVLVAGVGAVGTRAARQLVDTPGVVEVLLAGTDSDRLAKVAESLGEKASVHAFAPGDPIPEGIDAIACALPTGVDHAVAAAAITAGVPCVSSDDDQDSIRRLAARGRHAAGHARAGGEHHIADVHGLARTRAHAHELAAQSVERGVHVLEHLA